MRPRNPRFQPNARHSGDRPGVVLIITLIALFLLTALVLFVLNIGDQANRRQQSQDIADATAIAGATYMARGLNLVAHNNLAMSFQIATVNVLDSMPQATDFATREQIAFHEALQSQLARGLTVGGELAEIVTDIMDDFEVELQEELDQLIPVNEFYQSFDMTEMTYYNAPQGRGHLWKAMAALDELSQVTLETIPEHTQLMAVQAGEHAMRFPERTDTFVVPVRPETPWERGQFNDFERPVKWGILPNPIDETTIRRGPYDTVFGWHRTHGTCLNGFHRPGTRHVNTGGRGGVPIGRGAGGSGSGQVWVCTEYEVIGYSTWGTHRHQLDRVRNFVRGNLRNTRLDWWTNRMANFKLNYLWPGDEGAFHEGDGDARPDESYPELEEIVDPDWVMSYEEAREIARTRRQDIKETGYFRLEIKSRYPRNHPNFLDEGSWAPNHDFNRTQPAIVRARGWVDPDNWDSRSNVTKVVQHGWMDEFEYTVFYDGDVGIEQEFDEEGNPIPQPIYRIDHYWFAGVNVGEEVEVPNCYEGFNRNSSDAPAPVNISTEINDTDESRDRYLTFLAITRHSDTARAWPRGFWSRKPDPYMVAIAQAKVFNTHSWEAWTPMWNASLEPVDNWAQWQNRIVSSGTHDEVNDELLEFSADYFERTATLADDFLRH